MEGFMVGTGVLILLVFTADLNIIRTKTTKRRQTHYFQLRKLTNGNQQPNIPVSYFVFN